MQAGELTEDEFFEALGRSAARVLLIGRRALNVLGSPVMTTDYDVWVHIDDIELFNRAFEDLEHFPNRTPAEARARGRYVVENGERIDVLVARAVSASDGTILTFDDAWSRRVEVRYGDALRIALPSIDDLIQTKRWSMRPKDAIDIQWLLTIRGQGEPQP